MIVRSKHPEKFSAPDAWEAIFLPGTLEYPFRAVDWSILLLAGNVYADPENAGRLQSVLAARGEHEVIVSAHGGRDSLRAAWDGGSLEESLTLALSLSLLVHDDIFLFGKSCEWGMICTIGDFAIFGGEPPVIEAFERLSGGRDRLKRIFCEWVRSGPWYLSSDATARLLESAGWDCRGS